MEKLLYAQLTPWIYWDPSNQYESHAFNDSHFPLDLFLLLAYENICCITLQEMLMIDTSYVSVTKFVTYFGKMQQRPCFKSENKY